MIQSVDRAVRILTALQGARRMSLGELAAQLELPPSTVHGIVRTLTAHGMVVQERDSGRYRLGPATLRLGNVYLDTLDLRTRVATRSAALAAQTGLAVRTGVLLRTDVIVVHHVPRPDDTMPMPEVGIVIPAHASALGKALIAFDDEALGLVLDGAGGRSMTAETITDPVVLKEQLEDVRSQGLATEVEEAVLGECGLAAPIADALGEAVGAIGVVTSSAEWPVPATTSDAVRATALAISRELGATRWPPTGP